MVKILQYHFLWREEKVISVVPLAWIIDVFFLIIIDTANNFHSALQLAVCNDMQMFRTFDKFGKTSITFLSYMNCKIYRAFIGLLEGLYASGGSEA